MSTNERQKNLAINGTFDLPLDVHLHTLLSPDSAVPVDVYPALAIALGMPRIAITDHLDFDPREPGATLAPHQRRVEVVNELRRKFGDRLDLWQLAPWPSSNAARTAPHSWATRRRGAQLVEPAVGRRTR